MGKSSQVRNTGIIWIEKNFTDIYLVEFFAGMSQVNLESQVPVKQEAIALPIPAGNLQM